MTSLGQPIPSGRDRLSATSSLIISMLRGIFVYEGTRSTPLQLVRSPTTGPKYVPYEDPFIHVAVYNGIVLPAFHSLSLMIVLLIVDLIVRICFRNPPGISWEVITAHARNLTGPDVERRIIRSREVACPSNCYIGFATPKGYLHVHEDNIFMENDVVDAAPFDGNPSVVFGRPVEHDMLCDVGSGTEM